MRLSDLQKLVDREFELGREIGIVRTSMFQMEDKIVEAYRTAPGVSDPMAKSDPRYLRIIGELTVAVRAKNLKSAGECLEAFGYGTPEECQAIARHVRRRIRT